jgi:hypothetical protein
VIESGRHGHELIFETTGRKLDAVDGIVGINAALHIYSGHDSTLHDPTGVELMDPDEVAVRTLNPAERKELAEFMIARWRAFSEVQSI